MSRELPPPQTVAAKRAESRRAFLGPQVLNDAETQADFRRRAAVALRDFEALAEQDVDFSPFLEIGAGSAQRSTALMSRLAASGAALDISQNSLLNAPYVVAALQLDRVPMLVCADAHHIPFLPNTFRFVFAYRTLHHFENPVPVLAECARVLGRGGHLFFNEEPMDSDLRRWLRGGRTLSDPPTTAQRLAAEVGIEKVFWDDGAVERSLGMTEARFDMALWREALAPFEVVWIEVNRKLKLRTDLESHDLTSRLAGAIGGNVKGLCRKAYGEDVAAGTPRERLMCVDCGPEAMCGLSRSECAPSAAAAAEGTPCKAACCGCCQLRSRQSCSHSAVT